MNAHFFANGSSNAFVIAGKYFDLHASLVELGNCLASAFFWWVQKGQVANEHHVALIVYTKLADATRVTFLSNANHAHAFLIELVDAVHNALALGGSQRLNLGVQVNKGARVEDFLDSALSDHLRLVSFSVSHHNAHAATLKVKRDLVDLLVLNAQQVGGQFVVGSLDDCVVNEVAKARLEVAVQICVTEHARILFTQNVEVALKHNLVCGDGAGLVGAQDVHGTQVLDCGRVLNNNVLLGHLRSTARKASGHNNRQHLRGNAYGNRDAKEQRIKPVTLEESVCKEHDGAHDQHERDKYLGDGLEALVKAGLAGRLLEQLGHGAHVGFVAGCNYNYRCTS